MVGSGIGAENGILIRRGEEILVGSKKFIDESDIPTGSIESELIRLESEAKTIMLASLSEDEQQQAWA